MSMAPIKERLRAEMGLDPETLSRIALRAEVRKRMEACGLDTRAAYATLLQTDPEEFRRLANALVVHETSFFRYPASYGLLAEHARLQRVQLGQAPFRVLSVACSTGEEPASVVMTLLGVGLEPHNIRVEANDVSGRAIRYAREGRYRRRGVLRLAADVRERWFEEDDQYFRLDRGIIDCIHYRRANAMDPDPAGSAQKYDAIFCRNLLIYLVPEAREALLQGLIERLRPGGLLFVGHAEVAAARAFGLTLASPPDAFALRLASSGARPVALGPVSRRKTPLRATPPSTHTRSQNAPVSPPQAHALLPKEPVSLPKPPVVSTPPPESVLDRAAELADAGELDRARRLLSDLMAQGGANADHYHLLAVIEGARGREAATGDALRRALYLDPGHYPALVQLALLADAHGDRERARRTREKAERVRAAWDADRDAALPGDASPEEKNKRDAGGGGRS